MNTLTEHKHSRHRPHAAHKASRPLREFLRESAELASFVSDAIRDALRRRRQRNAVRSRVRMLATLSDSTLKDIGLHRSELGSIVAESEGYAEASRVRRHKDSAAPLY